MVLLMCAGCADEYPPEAVPAISSQPEARALFRPFVEPTYPIGAGDALMVNSYLDPSLKQPVVVQPDGKISLLLVGTVDAAGKTPEQLAEELSRSYAAYLDSRDISVTVTEVANMSVFVGGEVKSPTVVPIRGDLTLLQAITAAGGFLPSANRAQILILRPTLQGKFAAFQQDVNAVLHNQASEIYLHRHDIVYAPQTHITKVDLFIEQYINLVVPRSVNAAFGYQFINQDQVNPTIIAR